MITPFIGSAGGSLIFFVLAAQYKEVGLTGLVSVMQGLGLVAGFMAVMCLWVMWGQADKAYNIGCRNTDRSNTLSDQVMPVVLGLLVVLAVFQAIS